MKKRLDILISSKYSLSRSKAQQLIEEELVKVDDKIITKPSMLIEEDQEITIIEHKSYVSRGAYKLLKAIDFFALDFKDKVVLDMGASTGGFTEVSIEAGAKKVYSVDVGKGELEKSIACNKKVINMEGRDIRTLSKDECSDAQIVVGDLSFISLKHILPKIKELFNGLGYKKFDYRPFNIDIDIKKPEKAGLGTYTERLENGKRIQISGGLMLPWYFIVAYK